MNLIEVKCPFKNISKNDGKEYVCNRTCVKVEPGSRGEAWCRFCRKSFDFEISKEEYVFIDPEVKNG